jgi:hypothetical protein
MKKASRTPAPDCPVVCLTVKPVGEPEADSRYRDFSSTVGASNCHAVPMLPILRVRRGRWPDELRRRHYDSGTFFERGFAVHGAPAVTRAGEEDKGQEKWR